MNTIILTLSFVLVVTVYGAEEINIEQVFRNPFFSEVQRATKNKLERRAYLKLVSDGNKNGTGNDNRKQIIRENTNKINTYVDKDKRIASKFFSNRKKYRTYDVPQMKNSVFVNSPTRSYQKRLWNFKNKKDRMSIKSAFLIEKDQWKQKWNSTTKTSTNKNEDITFSSLSNNKKLDEQSITRRASPADRASHAISVEPIFNSTQNASFNSIEHVKYYNNNIETNNLHKIKQLGSMGFNMLSNLLGKQETEDLVNTIFNKYPINASNLTSGPIIKENIENFLTNFLSKKVRKRDIGTLFEKNAFEELSKGNSSNLSNNTLKRLLRSNTPIDSGNADSVNEIMDEVLEYGQRFDLSDIGKILDKFILGPGEAILGVITGKAIEILAKTFELLIKELGPKIITYVYRMLKRRRLFGIIVIHGATIYVSGFIAVVVGAFIMLAVAFLIHGVMPIVSTFIINTITPDNVTNLYLALVKAFDSSIGIAKMFDEGVKFLLKVVRLTDKL